MLGPARVEDMHNLVEYFERRVFLFTPNVCNATCKFCYVDPVLASTSTVSTKTLDQAVSLLHILSRQGFNQVRITGGEPLVFERLESLVARILDMNMSYTILTNGILLARYASMLEAFPPSKLTVSIHDSTNPGSVFGRRYPSEEVFGTVSRLSEKLRITATIVCTDSVLSSLTRTLSELSDFGFESVKLIIPNNAKSVRHSLADTFDLVQNVSLQFISSYREIRITDQSQTRCLLKKQGSLSFALPSLKFWQCCAMVGDESGEKISIDDVAVAQLLRNYYAKAQERTGFPCSTDLTCCPISLRRV